MLRFLRALGKSEHERIQEQLSAYLDGELSGRDQAIVERHLQTCGECAHDLAMLRWTVSLVQEVPTVPLPRSFTVRAADVQPARAPRRADLAYTYLRGATAVAAVLLALILSGDVLSQFFAGGAAPTPQVIEREVLVEKAVVRTVVVEKEVVREEVVIETVVVEAEKVVEKSAIDREGKGVVTTPPPAKPVIAAERKVAAEETAPQVQPTTTPPAKMMGQALATKRVGEELPKTEPGVEQDTPAPPAVAEAPMEAAPLATAPPPGTPTAATIGERERLAAAAATPTPAPTEVALELPEAGTTPSIAERRAAYAPSDRELSLWRQLEIGLLAAVIILGAATLIVRKGRQPGS